MLLGLLFLGLFLVLFNYSRGKGENIQVCSRVFQKKMDEIFLYSHYADIVPISNNPLAIRLAQRLMWKSVHCGQTSSPWSWRCYLLFPRGWSHALEKRRPGSHLSASSSGIAGVRDVYTFVSELMGRGSACKPGGHKLKQSLHILSLAILLFETKFTFLP